MPYRHMTYMEQERRRFCVPFIERRDELVNTMTFRRIADPPVFCTICIKPVDYIQTWRDISMHMFYVEYRCHGDEEEFELSDMELEEMLSPRSLLALLCATGFHEGKPMEWPRWLLPRS